MARINLFNVLALAVLLPVALALPWSMPPYASPSSWPESTSYPTASYPSWTGVTGTATGYSYSAATGTGTGTGWSSSTGWSQHEHQTASWAIEKRRALEGPRRRHFPHYYPAQPAAWGSSTSSAAPTAYPSGTATSWSYPTAAWPTATGSW